MWCRNYIIKSKNDGLERWNPTDQYFLGQKQITSQKFTSVKDMNIQANTKWTNTIRLDSRD